MVFASALCVFDLFLCLFLAVFRNVDLWRHVPHWPCHVLLEDIANLILKRQKLRRVLHEEKRHHIFLELNLVTSVIVQVLGDFDVRLLPVFFGVHWHTLNNTAILLNLAFDVLLEILTRLRQVR